MPRHEVTVPHGHVRDAPTVSQSDAQQVVASETPDETAFLEGRRRRRRRKGDCKGTQLIMPCIEGANYTLYLMGSLCPVIVPFIERVNYSLQSIDYAQAMSAYPMPCYICDKLSNDFC